MEKDKAAMAFLAIRAKMIQAYKKAEDLENKWKSLYKILNNIRYEANHTINLYYKNHITADEKYYEALYTLKAVNRITDELNKLFESSEEENKDD